MGFEGGDRGRGIGRAFGHIGLRQHALDGGQCPKPVDYDEATLKKISEALRALPADNVLRQAMEDYENERDDLRFLHFCQ